MTPPDPVVDVADALHGAPHSGYSPRHRLRLETPMDAGRPRCCPHGRIPRDGRPTAVRRDRSTRERHRGYRRSRGTLGIRALSCVLGPLLLRGRLTPMSDLIRMRTREGMKVAKAKGRPRGKQPKLSATQEAHLVKLYRAASTPSASSRSSSPSRGPRSTARSRAQADAHPRAQRRRSSRQRWARGSVRRVSATEHEQLPPSRRSQTSSRRCACLADR
jgi:hypothetical protein